LLFAQGHDSKFVSIDWELHFPNATYLAHTPLTVSRVLALGMGALVVHFVQAVGSIVAILVTAVGALGGLWGLVDRWTAWKKSNRRVGEQGATVFIFNREQTDTGATWEFLVGGDLIHALRGALEDKFGGRLQDLERVGDFYRFKVAFPPGMNPAVIESMKR
jgi:hypothetical protein